MTVAFDQVLAEKLASAPARGAELSGSRSWWAPYANPLYWHRTPPACPSRRAAILDMARESPEPAAGTAGLEPPAPPLTRAQHEAIGVLQALGATWLTPSSTSVEIRRAFRILARRLHPDCHPRSTADERARLGRWFGRLVDAYATLSRPAAH